MKAVEMHDSLSEAIIGFAQLARQSGLGVGIQETQEGLKAARLGLMANHRQFHYGLRSIFCSSCADTNLFDQLFEEFWHKERPSLKSRVQMHNQSAVKKEGSLVMMGTGSDDHGEDAGKNVAGAHAIERLRKTDFSKVTEIDSSLLEELAERLWKQMSLSLKRRLKRNRNQGKIDLRKTIRENISHGGEPIDLRFKKKKLKKHRLVVLLDVSGSMDKYSFFLLRFIYALQANFERVDSFIFSTELTCITDVIKSGGLSQTLAGLSERSQAWSSGTRVGACLDEFNSTYAKQLLSRNALVIILSDGLDTGEPEVLQREMKKVSRRAKKVIWLNPLKGMKDYQPIARGMSTALPLVDVFNSAHNLDSILELERYLAHA